MLLAVLCFTLLDTIAKGLVVGDIHPLQVVWGRYAFSLLPLLAVPLYSSWRRLGTRRPGLQLARGLTLIGATAAMFAGLRTLPLADAYALSYVSPVIVAVISYYAFAERLNRWQLTALALGLAGVMVVIRPAFAQAGVTIVFPLLMALSYAIYQVLTRVVRHADDAVVSVFYASLVGAGLTTLVLPFVWQPMPATHWLWFALMGACGLVGHWLLAVASRRAPASLLAPLSYTQLVYAALFGFFVFGAIPDRWTLVGAAIILIAGALLWRAAPRA